MSKDHRLPRWFRGAAALASLCAALLLPASASAAINSYITIEGSGSGEVVGIEPSPGAPEPIACKWNGETEKQTGVCAAEAQKPEPEAPFFAISVEHVAAPGSKFVEWKVEQGGAIGCSQGNPKAGSCSVTLSKGEIKIKAVFAALPKHALTLKKTGTGDGTVTSSPVGIECAPGCEEETAEFSEGVTVTLEAGFEGGSVFAGWSGCAAEAQGKCEVTISSAKQVEARFVTADTHVLIEGSGSGAVVPYPGEEGLAGDPQIDCRWDGIAEEQTGACDAAAVDLLGEPGVKVAYEAAPGSIFAGWEVIDGSAMQCEALGESCAVHKSGAEIAIKATFVAVETHPLDLSTSGSGSGSFKCDTGSGPEACEAEYLVGTAVTVFPVAQIGTQFLEWSGDCSGVDPEGCSLTMDEAHSVGALFDEVILHTKQPVDYFGTASGSGSRGGEFNLPQGVAVNDSGTGPADAGDIYVVDTGNNRIQRFDADGNFISAWGADVVGSGGTGDVGDAAVKDFEVCTVATECQAGVAAGGNGAQAGNGALAGPQAVAVDGDSGDVFVSDAANNRIDVYDGAGSFLYAVGRDVAEPDGGTSLEVCDGAADACRAGDAGLGPGEVGSFVLNSNPGMGIAVSPPDGDASTGKVYLADTANRRVDTYDLDGSSPASLGGPADFGSGQPRQVAVDSRGILYASNSKSGGEIERYDTQNADGGGAGFLAPIRADFAGVDETQTLRFEGFADGDAFTIGNLPASCSASSTAPIAWSSERTPLAQSIKAALEARCGTGNFSIGESSVTAVHITFEGTLGATDVPTLGCATLSGVGTCSVAQDWDSQPTASGPLAEGETKGLAIDPDSDGGAPGDGSEEDVLYVLRDPEGTVIPSVVEQFGPVNDPGRTAAPLAVDDVHGAAARFGYDVRGLGISEASGRLFVPSNQAIAGAGDGNRVYVLDEPPAAPPSATLDPVADPGTHSATFSGAVTPGGARTNYRFEYVADAQFQESGFAGARQVPVADADAGAGEDPVAVERTAPSLAANTTYHVRLLAKRVFESAQAIAGPLTFTTDAAAPSIVATANVTSTESATLRGAIDPEGEAVSDYHFQWGTDTGYGNTTPVETLPAGSDPVAVAEQLSGLAPATTYHYRLLATNATGTTTGPDQTFATPAPQPPPGECPNAAIRKAQGAEALPECRAYELVSPYPSGGIPADPNLQWLNAAEDGERIATGVLQPLPGSQLALPPDQLHYSESLPQYAFARGAQGWRTEEVGFGSSPGGGSPGWSTDAGAYLFSTSSKADVDGRLDPEDQNDSQDVYLWRPGGALTWVSRDPRVPADTPQAAYGRAVVASKAEPGAFTMSADGHTVAFRSQRQLLDADATPRSGIQRDPYALYKWSDGQLRLLGVRPDGSVPAQGSALGSGAGFSTSGAVARDGSRVVWSAEREDGKDNAALYLQRDGQPTVEVSKETGVASLPPPQPYDVTFRGAGADGSRVFFTSASRLTPNSGAGAQSGGAADLYAYDLAADEVRDLTPRLDGIEDPSADPAIADRARVLGIAANSEDGRIVYFPAEAAYETAPNPQGDLPVEGEPNLYMAKLGESNEDPVQLRFVATLDSGEGDVWQTSWEGKAAYVSPDGRVLAFGSSQSLTGQALGGTSQLFVYDAGAGTLACASCPGDGSLPSGDVDTYPGDGGGQGTTDSQEWQERYGVRRWVAADGTVFFHTKTPLLPEDENVVDDVYEYREGRLALLSAGTGSQGSRFRGASRDGSTVFLTTYDQLVQEDKEPGVAKLYAARVNGGFPYTPPEPPCDLGAGACEGAPTSAPPSAGAGTAAFEGPGDPVSKRTAKRCPKGKRKVRREGRVHCAKRHHRKHAHGKRGAKNNRRAAR